MPPQRNFNPRAPCGARLITANDSVSYTGISTHAPLAGRDERKSKTNKTKNKFQPTRPLRGATRAKWYTIPKSVFQPTRPLRGATAQKFSVSIHTEISTHAPLAGRDYSKALTCLTDLFQPTRPLRGATGAFGLLGGLFQFQPTRPLRGATYPLRGVTGFWSISTHAPLAGRDSKRVQITMHIFAITDKFQMLLHRMPPVRAFCSFLMQENHADFGCEPPK